MRTDNLSEIFMASRAGLEPATSKLTVLHSTIELPRI